MSDESFLSQVKRLLVGAPIPSHLAHHERFSKVTGLAVLSSDALSSVAYATEEILRVLLIGGVAALGLVTPIGAVIATMLRRGRLLVPPDDSRLSERRRRVHRREGQPRHRCRALIAAAVAADRLRPHRRRSASRPASPRSRRRFPQWRLDRVEMTLAFVALLMVGNLARHPRVGPHLRRADLLLHRQHARR